ncbi:MAG: hypothetical protein BWY57_01024 [Betaproteobacteria bacterium ADurb.Bin341]|nr:MAG: hypothetical protein BWY57_01024 [Betaproteobacteria bacterium ADurb.Bin341]
MLILWPFNVKVAQRPTNFPSPACGTSPKGAGRNVVVVPSKARDGLKAHKGVVGNGHDFHLLG